MQTTETKSLDNAHFIFIKATEGEGGSLQLVENDGLSACSTASTRRAHKKSKTGCNQCKLRKIKCDERRPKCLKCLHKALPCLYSCDSNSNSGTPGTRDISRRNQQQQQQQLQSQQRHGSSSAPSHSISAVTDSFTLQDLRLFHHFLIKATPYLPLGNRQIWSRDIPQLSHHNRYLMYSMLSLGATHLSRSINDESLVKPALTYRIQAIRGLRDAMSYEAPAASKQQDAIIASCYSLLFASSYMSDGFWDYISFLRLTDSMTSKVKATPPRQNKVMFNLTPEHHYQHIKDSLPYLPHIDIRLLRSAIVSLDNLSTLLHDDQQVEFCNILRTVCYQHIESPQGGYIAFGKGFQFWYDLSEEAFHSWMMSKTLTVTMLCAHFVSILLMMLPMSVVENRSLLSFQTMNHLEGMLGWIDTMCSNLSREEEFFAQFPISVAATVRDEGKALELGDRPLVMQLDATSNLAAQLDAMQLGAQPTVY